MRTYLIILLSLTINSLMQCQNWQTQIYEQSELIPYIKSGLAWNEILEIGKSELRLEAKYLNDIESTIRYRNRTQLSSKLDSFFLIICDSIYGHFPYRTSGHLSKRLYALPQNTDKHNTQDWLQKLPRDYRYKDLTPMVAEIVNIERAFLIPKLIEYLDNHSATRLVINPMEWDESPFYLSISDVAMEIIEIVSYCDFYDNAAHSNWLYSNSDPGLKKRLKDEIEFWYSKTENMTQIEAVNYFLEELATPGHSYVYTINNILFLGDTVRARELYRNILDKREYPLHTILRVRDIMYSIGDEQIIDDCLELIQLDNLNKKSDEQCAKILLNTNTHRVDSVLAASIAKERSSLSAQESFPLSSTTQYIFSELALVKDSSIPLTLLQLMYYKNEVKHTTIDFKNRWKYSYPEKFKDGYRVCDFALLKYNELVEPLQIDDWNNIQTRNRKINKLISKYDD